MTRRAILGISAFYHDSAAALLVDGHIVAAAQEERFTRIKNDPSFPEHAIRYVLEEGGIELMELTTVVFYDKPFLKFERLLETYHAFAPRGLKSFVTSMPVWIKEKIFMKRMVRNRLRDIADGNVPLLFCEHHLSHAASAFYPSPFDDAAILIVDGVGEWTTTTIGHGRQNTITILKELSFPHSVGLLYAAFTYYLGFKVNSGEYKVMGLAAYGHHASIRTRTFKEKILSSLVDLRNDGSLLLNMDYFCFATGLTMTHDKKWNDLFGVSRRLPETSLEQHHMDMALALQEVTETIMLRLAQTARELTGSKNLVMAGGVALNCVANQKILASGIFDRVWIQPAAGDAGGAVGAAAAAFHIHFKEARLPSKGYDAMKGAYLGPSFSSEQVERVIRGYEAKADSFESFDDLIDTVSKILADGHVVGWFQDRMEFGPRALGNRSILADPRHPEMQKKLNLKIKFREGFRPFAPSIREEDAASYFDQATPSPYMLFVAPLNDAQRHTQPQGYDNMPLYERLYHARSYVPAVTHIDYSARVQTVHSDTNPKFWQLLTAFKNLTGCPMLINTSFNVRGEPIVCTPTEAYRGFMNTDMDYLVIGNHLFDKRAQLKTSNKKEVEFLPD